MKQSKTIKKIIILSALFIALPTPNNAITDPKKIGEGAKNVAKVSEGILATIIAIPRLVDSIKKVVSSITSNISTFTQEIGNYAKVSAPDQAIDPSVNITTSLLNTVSALTLPLTYVHAMLYILARQVIHVFDAKVGDDLTKVTHEMKKVETDIAKVISNLKKLIPIVQTAGHQISQHSKNMVNHINNSGLDKIGSNTQTTTAP